MRMNSQAGPTLRVFAKGGNHECRDKSVLGGAGYTPAIQSRRAAAASPIEVKPCAKKAKAPVVIRGLANCQ